MGPGDTHTPGSTHQSLEPTTNFRGRRSCPNEVWVAGGSVTSRPEMDVFIVLMATLTRYYPRWSGTAPGPAGDVALSWCGGDIALS